MNKITLAALLVTVGSVLSIHTVNAQNKTKPSAKKVAPAKKQVTKTTATPKEPSVRPIDAAVAHNTITADGYTHLESGLEYKITKHGRGLRHPAVGDHLEMHVHMRIKDSVMFDSRKMNNGNAVPFQVQPPSFKGDFIEGLMQLVSGDSAMLRLPVDSIIKQNKQLMPGMKNGDILEYDVELVSVMTRGEYKKDQFERNEKQRILDDTLFKDYFNRNNIIAKKTPSGLYYTISKEGTGDFPATGQVVSVNYTGRFLEGKTFDSNTDPDFHHPEPFPVALGRGAVIKGWDEGLALFKKGSKGTLYIPSGLAYGLQGNSNIPGNTVLVFDIEISDIKTQAQHDDKLIKEYLTKNNIEAKKTASGLYYYIIEEGKGSTPVAGDSIAVNYTGKTLDGRKFNSNVDTAFHQVAPLVFGLGKGIVIKGWEEGFTLLKRGSKAVFIVPSELAYGHRGQKELGIPPSTVLMFNVHLEDNKKR